MDANTFFDGVKLDGDTQKILTERYGQVSKTLEQLQADAAAYEERFTGSVKDRDKAKARVKELEDRIRKGDFDGAKELKELNEKLSKDFEVTETSLNEYKGKYEKLEKDFKAKSTELDKFIQIQKDKILKDIPTNLKETASKLGLEDLSNLYEGLVKEKIITDKSIHPNNNNGKPKPKTLSEWKANYLK